MKKRLLSLVLAAALVCGTLPVPALAEEEPSSSAAVSGEEETSGAEISGSIASTETAVSSSETAQQAADPSEASLYASMVSLFSLGGIAYLDETGAAQTYNGTYTSVTSSSTEWTAGWYLAEGEVTIDQRVNVSGDVKLILADNASLTVNGGIDVAKGDTFTVYAQSSGDQMGALTSQNWEYEEDKACAGIGSSLNQDAGTIIINGGRVTASGSRYSAGIGSGRGGNATVITINGGIVDARMRDFYGAGIGAGYRGNGGTITINGGKVNAFGYSNAGIGAGANGYATIAIHGGTIQTYANGGGAGIGGGGNDAHSTDITITGGTISAGGGSAGSYRGATGAGIGGSGYSNNVNILITGGVITASGGGNGGYYNTYASAGIGGSSGENVNSITITGGVIKANSDVAGIGKTGSFSTGADGNAVIFASSIPEQPDREQWRGLIFEGSNGKIYGDSYTVNQDLTIPEGKILTVESGKTLEIQQGVNLQNNGEIRIDRDGIYTGNEPNGNPLSYQIEWDMDGDGTIDDSTYCLKGEIPDHEGGEKAPDTQQVYSFAGWKPEPEATTGTAQYTAVFEGSPRPYTVTIPQNQAAYSVIPVDGTTVEYGKEFAFTVTISDGYKEGDSFAVKANGSVLNADDQGVYHVQVLGETAVTVEGVDDIAAPTVDVLWDAGKGMKELTEGGEYLATNEFAYIEIQADDPSGIQTIYYQLSGRTVSSVPSRFALVRLFDDYRGTITVWAVDKAGNESRHITYNEVCVDQQAPTVPTVDTNGYDGNWTSGPVNLTLRSDALSGIDHYEYSKDGGANWEPVTGDTLTLTESGFPVDYIFRAVSAAGNTGSASAPVTVRIDKEGPDLILTGNTDEYLTSDTVEILPLIGLAGISQVQRKTEDGSWVALTASEEHHNLYKYTVTENGTYTFRAISGVGVVGEEATITYNKIDNTKPVVEIDSGSYTDGSWTNGTVTLAPVNEAQNLGTTTFTYKVDDGDWKNYTGAIAVSDETAGKTYTFKATSASGVESDEASITVKIDKTVPDGDIRIAENSAKKVLNQITFGLFFNKTVDVTITGEDALSGVANIEYYRSADILTEDEVKSIADWSEYSALSETAEDAKQVVYYVRITDKAGNTTIFGSDGMTFDTAAPVISGVVNGGTYYTTQTVTVTDANLDSLTLNGQTVSSPVTLPGDLDATYTLVASDKAGNRAQVEVTMKSLAALDETLEDIAPDNVTSQDRDKVESVLDKVEDLLQGDSLTEEEKAKLEETKNELEDLLDQLEQAQAAGSTANTDKVENITADNVQTSDKEDLEAAKNDIENALENFGGNYTEEEKGKLEEALDRIESALETIDKAQAAGSTANTDKVENITADNVQTSDKEDLEAAKNDIENALENFGGNYTEEEKGKLEEALDRIESALETIDKAQAAGSTTNTDKVENITADNVQTSDKEDLEAAKNDIENALENFGGNYTEEEKGKLEEALDRIESALETIDKAQAAGSTTNTDKAENITADNVQTGNKEDLEAAKNDIENALENFGGNYTEEEKGKLEEALDRIQSALETIDKVQGVQNTVTALPDTVSPDDLETVEKIEAAKENYDSLTDHEKSMLGKDVVKKLQDLLTATTDYRILDGNGSVWTLSSADTLSIRANGSPRRLTAVKVDGQVLTQERYTVRAGSTIVTLKTDYLNTLAPGDHTLTFVYTNGQTEAVFKVASAPAQTETTDTGADNSAESTAPQSTAPANNSSGSGVPQTGDPSALGLWGGLILLCGAALVALKVTRRKKQ